MLPCGIYGHFPDLILCISGAPSLCGSQLTISIITKCIQYHCTTPQKISAAESESRHMGERDLSAFSCVSSAQVFFVFKPPPPPPRVFKLRLPFKMTLLCKKGTAWMCRMSSPLWPASAASWCVKACRKVCSGSSKRTSGA